MQTPLPTTEGLTGPLFGAYTLPTFKFQPRRESIDWRRISALDVDRVARELDVATLQENITGVTFCNLDRETCSRCGQPVDPALLKVLRLAQLIIEYLLHCQDCLSTSVAQLEARLQASLGQQQRGQQELGRQADELKGVREESRRRRKMISALQQLLMQTGAHSYHTCHLCDKTFMNATFLRGHMQRRHTGTAGGKQKQEEPVEEVLEELRAKLKWTQGELEAQREAERQRQLQEAELTRQREIEAKKEFDEWKEKEQTKFYGELDKLKKLFWDEVQSVANQNSTLEEKLQALQCHSVTQSNLGSLRDEESEERLRQAQELQALREKMETQRTEWKRKMKTLREQHTVEKREVQGPKHLGHLLLPSQATAESWIGRGATGTRTGAHMGCWYCRRKLNLPHHSAGPYLLKEENERLQATLTQDQRKAAAQSQRQISALRAQLQKQARLIASQEEKIQALSCRKAEEPEDPREEQRKVLAALRRNPTLLKQFRPILEDTLEEKLESMGIKRDAKGISLQTLGRLESLLRAQRGQKARKFAEFLRLREKLVEEASSRVEERQKGAAGSQPVQSRRSTLVTREAQPKPRTLNVALPSKPAQPPTPAPQTHNSRGPGPTQVSTPVPHPRANGPPSTASPGPGLSTTSPFSSEEDSEGDAVKPLSLQPPQAAPRMAARAGDGWDWSDTETSEEHAQPPGQGSAGLASSETLVQSMVRNLEKQLETPVKKPSGGVSLFSRPSTGPRGAAPAGRKAQFSEDESDLEISSLEDISQDLDQREKPKPLSRSKLPETFGNSPWSSGQSRVAGW
ncbi:cilium assembly protein DZIP1L isoform X2 [Oryctolagus cuniculus]|uniref:cilium assembly protein DZIP1L isoform X2 n=1 Tax=Oryctolagus cuniculus TaxID=9986 RepID=UPI003879457E